MSWLDRIALLPAWYHIRSAFGGCFEWGEFNLVCDQYDQPHRYYHTLVHLRSCMDIINRFYSEAPEINHIRVAIFYHDIVYDIGGKENEKRSAARFLEYADQISLPERDTQLIQDLIIMTENHHLAPDATMTHRIMNDVDMSILAASQDSYLKYAKNIWLEYQDIGVEEYRLGRLSFLSSVDPSDLFHTKPMIDRLDLARRNIELERDILDNRPWEIIAK